MREGDLWKIKFDLTREYAVVTKKILTKEIVPWGGGPLENKIWFNQGMRHHNQRNSHQDILPWGWGPLKNKIRLDQGIRRRDQIILTKEILP